MTNTSRMIGALVSGAVALTACGLPIDQRVQTFDDVPYDLDATSTTTSSTEVPNPQTTIDGAEETTTTIVETRPVDVVYLIGSSGELQPITIALPTPVSDRLLIEQLVSPPPGTGVALRTEVDRGLITGFTVDRGLAVIDLSPSTIARLSSLEQRRAIAQIALTLTLFTTAEGGIGQVSFTVSDSPISVYVPSRGENSEPGEPLAWSDFSSLIAGAPETTTTTVARTTTTAATTTVPPSTETSVEPNQSSTSLPNVPSTTSTTQTSTTG